MSSISTGLSQKWIRRHKQLISPAPTLEKFSLDPLFIPYDFTYVTVVGTISSKHNITEETISFDINLSQYVKTNTPTFPLNKNKTLNKSHKGLYT